MDELKDNFEYLNMIIHYLDKGKVWEVLTDETNKYYGSGIGFTKKVREPAFKALKWVMQNKDYNFKELGMGYVETNEEFLGKCIVLYEYMTKFNLG